MGPTKGVGVDGDGVAGDSGPVGGTWGSGGFSSAGFDDGLDLFWKGDVSLR